MIKIKKFTFNPFSENTYIVWDEETREAAVVDPGMFDESEQNEFDDFIKENSIKLKHIINTHCHIDHILGCKFVKDNYSVDYYVPEKDVPLIEFAKAQAGMFNLSLNDDVPKPDKFLSEETDIKLGANPVKILSTPGHSPGEVCLYFDKEKYCITGDVLFKESIGRTDLWGADFNTLISSIKNKLLTLPDDVTIFPGHGEKSTIGYEKINNPFLD